LSGAAERNENIIYMVYDNEGYMNKGVQRSSSTPYLARTTTTPAGIKRRGKEQNSKYVPLLMMFHGISYVATASIAYPLDFARKLTRAIQIKDGMSYLQDKYRHITPAEMEELQERVNARYEVLKSLARRHEPYKV